MSMLYVDDDWVAVHWHPRTRCVETAFKRAVQGDRFVGALEDALQLLATMRAPHWLGDLRRCGAIEPDLLGWIRQYWAPRAIEAGVRRLAWLEPGGSLTRVEAAPQGRPSLVPSLRFGNRAMALRWLREPVQ